MRTEITGKDMVVTQALHDHVHAKIIRFSRDVSKVETVKVTLWVEKGEHWAQASVRMTGVEFVCKAKHSDMYTAIKLVGKQVLRGALKHKVQRLPSSERRQSIRHMPSDHVQAEVVEEFD